MQPCGHSVDTMVGMLYQLAELFEDSARLNETDTSV